ncbi:MAG: hypothetical protein U0491_01730 [Candidatus Saccharimonadales bacterium]
MTLKQQEFIDTVWVYYSRHGRHNLPWRLGVEDKDFPYHVLVSEVMLQQTQVSRVIAKYAEWLMNFPTVESVANASFTECLRIWTGLGYNRRARFLHETCKQVQHNFNGNIPSDVTELVTLPGIGINTAGAISVYGFNIPQIFVETNIRTVYIKHFFESRQAVTDTEIREELTKTVDTEHPREWYWALMDYGSHLKRTQPTVNDQSAHYVKQSKFEGSRRQVRSRVLKAIQYKPQSFDDLADHINDDRLADVIAALEHEGFIHKTGVIYTIAT